MTTVGILALVHVALLAAALAGGGAWLRHSRRAARTEAEASRARHYELCEGFSQLAGAYTSLQQQLADLAARVERAERPVVTQAVASGRAYELAARLAAGGAATTELVASCGLTPAEAELAVLVHGTRRRAAATH